MFFINSQTIIPTGYTAVAFNNNVTLFDPVKGKIHELTSLPETRSLHCVVVVDHYVIVAGGFDNFSCITNEVYCLDLAQLTWTTLPHMKVN